MAESDSLLVVVDDLLQRIRHLEAGWNHLVVIKFNGLFCRARQGSIQNPVVDFPVGKNQLFAHGDQLLAFIVNLQFFQFLDSFAVILPGFLDPVQRLRSGDSVVCKHDICQGIIEIAHVRQGIVGIADFCRVHPDNAIKLIVDVRDDVQRRGCCYHHQH